MELLKFYTLLSRGHPLWEIMYTKWRVPGLMETSNRGGTVWHTWRSELYTRWRRLGASRMFGYMIEFYGGVIFCALPLLKFRIFKNLFKTNIRPNNLSIQRNISVFHFVFFTVIFTWFRKISSNFAPSLLPGFWRNFATGVLATVICGNNVVFSSSLLSLVKAHNVKVCLPLPKTFLFLN